MKSYYFTIAKYNDVYSTDLQTLKWLADEVRKHIPSCRVEYYSKDLQGEPHHIKVDQLQGKDLEFNQWVWKMLCQGGWEPIQFRLGDTVYPLAVCFRKELQ